MALGVAEMDTRLQPWPSLSSAAPTPADQTGQRQARSKAGREIREVGTVCTGCCETAITSEPQRFMPTSSKCWVALGTTVREEGNSLSVLRELRAKFAGSENCVAKLRLPTGSVVPSRVGDCGSLGDTGGGLESGGRLREPGGHGRWSGIRQAGRNRPSWPWQATPLLSSLASASVQWVYQ